MKFISHRGNLNGPNSCEENTIVAIQNALNEGYECEIDINGVWDKIDGVYLGHDKLQEYVYISFLENPKLWVHCKNEQALKLMWQHCYLGGKKINYFYHDKDDYTITSNGNIWCYPGKYISGSIAVLPENIEYPLNVFNAYNKYFNVGGICSDQIAFYKRLIKETKYERI